MSLTVATYKTCPHCNFEFGTTEALKPMLGIPHLECPSCKNLIPTGQQPWSLFGPRKKVWFIFTRIIQFALAGVIIGGLIIRQFELDAWIATIALVVVAMIVIGIQGMGALKKIQEVEARYRQKDFQVRGRL